jgi:CRP/FNR family transcriptional regulator, cyclic AMP receptor protein
MSSFSIFTRQRFNAGTMIFEQGEPGYAMYILQSGRVEIIGRQAGNDVVLAEVMPGGVFGEMALIGNAPRAASAVVREPAVVVVIPQQVLREKMEAADPYLVSIIRGLIESLRRTNGKVIGTQQKINALMAMHPTPPATGTDQ